MSSDVRDRMADTAARLLAERGYQSTSFSEVIDSSGAPRGSIYHHFPGGKDEPVAHALDRQAARVIAGLDRLEGRTPVEVVAALTFADLAAVLISARSTQGNSSRER